MPLRLATMGMSQVGGPLVGVVRVGGVILITWVVFQLGVALVGAAYRIPGVARRLHPGAGGELLREVELFDLFRGEQLGEGRKSLAYRLTYQAEDRTLTDAEVADLNRRGTSWAVRGSQLVVRNYTHTRRVVVVPAGTLDQDPGIRPDKNIYCASRAEWYTSVESLPQHDEGPPR